MRATKARVGFAMVMAWMCFGCKGLGGLGKVAGAAAAVAVRTTSAAVVAHNITSGGSGSSSDTDYDASFHNARYQVPATPPPAEVAGCVELPPAPERPGDRVWLRGLNCRGHVLVQDAYTGLWRNPR